MIRDNYLDINKIIQNKKFLKLFRAVEEHGGALRFVGGAVRDALRGLKSFDLDLATDLSPEELVEACDEHNLKTVPIGIKFGTVGVVIDNQVLEVTSLRKDVKTDGRHAEVEFTTDWEIDAGRRDLTINAVYADEKGNVFDYYNGIDDLEKGVVRFIGSPAQRIKEDYLRILRFFRFYSLFAKTPVDKKALQACNENKDGLKNLSMERIRDEFFKILLTPRAGQTIKIMAENDILGYVLPAPKDDNIDKLDFFINDVNVNILSPDPVRRMFILYTPQEDLAENMATRMKFSKKQKQDFIEWARINVSLDDFIIPQELKKMIYLHGKDFAKNKLLIEQALQKRIIPSTADIIKNIDETEVPVFPLRGKDIIETGIADNRQIGAVLDNLEQIWVNSDFQLSKEQLLSHLPELKTA